MNIDKHGISKLHFNGLRDIENRVRMAFIGQRYQMITYVKLTESVVGYKYGRELLSCICSLNMLISLYKENVVAKFNVGVFGGVMPGYCEKLQSYQGNVKPFHAPV